MNKDNKSFGIPIPYASTKLATPKNIINKIISPFKFWEFILFITGFVVIFLTYLVMVLGYEYSSTIFGAGGLLTSISFGYRIIPQKKREVITHDIPSLSGVYMKEEFVKAGSLVMVYTIIASLLTFSIYILTHMLSITTVDATTRMAGTLLIGIGLLSSYSIVKKCCSKNNTYPKNSNLVDLIPEITLVASFIISLFLFAFTSFIYNGPPIIETNIIYTFTDSILIIFLLNVIYIWAVWKIE